MEHVQYENRPVERLIRIDEVKRLTGISAATLYRKISAKEFPRPVRLRAVNVEVLGKACTEMFGPRKRVKAQQGPTALSKRRPWGYDVPTGNTWQRKLDARLGIKK